VNIHILDVAYRHLRDGARFYERQSPGLGSHFRTSLLGDIERLRVSGGGHQIVYGHFFRAVSRRFPCGIYYKVENDDIRVHAVLDSRRDPDWIREQLK